MNKWIRVTKAHPCPVCKKDSWCLIGETLVLCMRVQSPRPKELKSGETGWFHSLDSPMPAPPPRREIPQPKINCRSLMARWRGETEPSLVQGLANHLGVEQWTLDEHGLCAAWAQRHAAWAFSMWDGQGHLIGIRLRSESGKKWAVEGTHAGIFVPNMNPLPTLLICEGPTDTCAALSMGYYAVGRPSCSGGAPMIKDLIHRTRVRQAVIVADADDPGLNGAKSLIKVLQVPACILTLPAKDVREFYRNGGDRQTLDALARQSVWHYRNK